MFKLKSLASAGLTLAIVLSFQNCQGTNFDAATVSSSSSTSVPAPASTTASETSSAPATGQSWKFTSQIGPAVNNQHFGIDPLFYREMAARPKPNVGDSCNSLALSRSFAHGGMYEDVSECSLTDTSCANYGSGAVCCAIVRDYMCN